MRAVHDEPHGHFDCDMMDCFVDIPAFGISLASLQNAPKSTAKKITRTVLMPAMLLSPPVNTDKNSSLLMVRLASEIRETPLAVKSLPRDASFSSTCGDEKLRGLT